MTKTSYVKMTEDNANRRRDRRTYLYVLIGEAIEEESFIHLDGDELSLCVGEDGLVEKPYSLRKQLIDQIDACDDSGCLERITATRDVLLEMLPIYEAHVRRLSEGES